MFYIKKSKEYGYTIGEEILTKISIYDNIIHTSKNSFMPITYMGVKK